MVWGTRGFGAGFPVERADQAVENVRQTPFIGLKNGPNLISRYAAAEENGMVFPLSKFITMHFVFSRLQNILR